MTPPLRDELIVDSFAGGGGASLGIEMALGRPPDIAINHDEEAIALHAANHPETRHYAQNVWRIDPDDVVRQAGGRRVGLLWASPDCKHFSKAKGSKPVKPSIRDLAWVVVLWARRVRPRVICLENVEEFRDWGPLVEKRDAEGRPVRDLFGNPVWIPCPERKGQTFDRWVAELRRLGYRVEWRELRACDYGAPTIRKRLFLIARCDGRKIVWPKPTHGDPRSEAVKHGRLPPWLTAAGILDWAIPCPSIFLTREEGRAIGVNRPLAEATMARIAKGIRRYVIEAAAPFVVPVTHAGDQRVHPIDEPLRTITTAQRGELALVSPTLIQTGYGERPGQDPRVPGLDKPLGTVVAGGAKHALVAAFLAQHNGGQVGHGADRPLSTITARGTNQALVAAHLVNLRGADRGGRSIEEPVPTVTAGPTHVAEVRAFLIKYYGSDQDPRLEEPLHTVTTKDRFGLVTVAGETYRIADIGMRMLTPRELFRAQGFPDSYRIDVAHAGRELPKTSQIRMCGNSVSPPVAAAIVAANYGAAASEAEAVA